MYNVAIIEMIRCSLTISSPFINTSLISDGGVSMTCKQCDKTDYMRRVLVYWNRCTNEEKAKVVESIIDYYRVNNDSSIIHNDSRDIFKFCSDNYGDYTIIGVVTGFNG